MTVEEAKAQYHRLLVDAVQKNVTGRFKEIVDNVALNLPKFKTLTPRQLEMMEKAYYRVTQELKQKAEATPGPQNIAQQIAGGNLADTLEDDCPF